MALPYVKDDFVSGPRRQGRIKTRLSANGTVVLPAGALATRIYFRNRTANAVTGGIRIGTSDGGTQVVTAQAVAASVQATIVPTITGYSLAQPQVDATWYIQAVSAWNSAAVDILIDYDLVVGNSETV